MERVDYFGESVAMDGDIIIIGAHENPSRGLGAVYIFWFFDNITISQIYKLTASNGMMYDGFGSSVAIHGNYILVGAPWVDVNGFGDAGSAYLFGNPSKDPTIPEWTQFMQFQPNDLTVLDFFGISVAMDENIVVIGTSDPEANAAYVFEPVSSDAAVDSSASLFSSWTQTAKRTGSMGGNFRSSVTVATLVLRTVSFLPYRFEFLILWTVTRDGFFAITIPAVTITISSIACSLSLDHYI
jgi:hypothetical protein